MNEPTNEEMNALQGETNFISDNCVTWADVAECDRARALGWLQRRRIKLRWERTWTEALQLSRDASASAQ